MSESKLRSVSLEFSVQIIELVKELKSKHETVISNQIGRSGTSIGANIYEANYAQGKGFYFQAGDRIERGKRNRLLAGTAVSYKLH